MKLTEVERERETERQTRQIDRQTGRQTETEALGVMGILCHLALC